MNPDLPSFPNNVSNSISRFQMVCPEASTRKIFGGRKRVGKRRSGEGRRRIITTIGMVGTTTTIRRSGKYNDFGERFHGG